MQHQEPEDHGASQIETIIPSVDDCFVELISLSYNVLDEVRPKDSTRP